MQISADSKVVFIGDSITAAARELAGAGEEMHWGNRNGLGSGYVAQVNALLGVNHPAQRIRVLNAGVGGNTVLDLADRWERDVLAAQPDWLVVMIGVNDVWRQFDTYLAAERHVLPERFEETLGRLVDQVRPHLDGLVLMSPFMIEPNRDDPMRRRMDEYGAIVREVAAKEEAIFVDVQAAFDALLNHRHPMSLAWDRIHPTATGHLVIAKAFLDAVGFRWAA